MLTSILIIAFSLVLFVYWFRYSCILLLRNAAEQLPEPAPERDSRFNCADVLLRLRNGDDMDPLHRALHRDYQVFSYLLEHAAGLELGSLEDRLLVFDYKVLQFYYRVTHSFFPQQARKALTEMATVLDVLTQKMIQQAGV